MPVEAERDGQKVPPRSLAGLSALVVDDNAHARAIAAGLLMSGGLRSIHEADHALAGLEALAAQEFSVVIVDGVMPRIDGFEFIRRLRRMGGAARATPVVLATGYGDAERIMAGRDAGADEICAKPLSAARFLRCVYASIFQTRPFVVSAGYVGPCRRRRADDEDYDGPRRRSGELVFGDILVTDRR